MHSQARLLARFKVALALPAAPTVTAVAALPGPASRPAR